jgi:hypothetical protein
MTRESKGLPSAGDDVIYLLEFRMEAFAVDDPPPVIPITKRPPAPKRALCREGNGGAGIRRGRLRPGSLAR